MHTSAPTSPSATASADAGLPEPRSHEAPAATAAAPGPSRRGPKPAPVPTNPVLARLAQWYPALFGARLLPLKRGILQDLLAAPRASSARPRSKPHLPSTPAPPAT